MIGKKYIIFSYLLANCVLLSFATKNDCGESLEDIEEIAYRYLNNTVPLRYQIYLDPCVADGNFSGYIHMDLLIIRPAKNLTLHSHQLYFCEEGVYLTLKGSLNETFEALKPITNVDYGASSLQDSDEILDDPETIRPSGFVYYEKAQTVTLKFDEFLKPGRYSLEINYIGAINTNSVGVYRKFYKDVNGENRAMLLTNFFPTSARRIFPCRDEPAIKAEIYFTMQTSLNFTTIMANTPENYVDYKEGQRWFHYYPIANSSTYQLNFAVLSNVKNTIKKHSNKTYITYATTSDLKSVKLMQDTHTKAMAIMEDYLNINYPLDTFVNLIVPEKIEAASSSSLGFIITKRTHASYSERLGPQKKKEVIFRASREIGNQWFKQLISPTSWRYVWLNDGLSEYLKYYIADKIMPHWRLKEMFVIWELQRRSFIPNKITDSPSLNKNISNNPKDVQCSLLRSASTTSRSASILRMMSHFLSESIMKSGISNFLQTNKHKAVEPKDFWKAIQNAVNASNDERLINLNISEIMQTWTNAEFYPIINVTRNYTTGTIKVTQTRAVSFFGLTEKNATTKWWIPINYATQTVPDFNVTIPSHWLKPNMKRLTIEGVDPKDWVVFNIQQTGYYRVLYDEENWKRLASFLNSKDYYKIPPINRAQIINDAVQFSLKRHLNMNVFLNLISYLQQETDYIPWYDAHFIFSFLNYHLSNTKAYDSLKNFSLRLIIPLVDKIGYEDRPDDDFSTLLLRRISNHWACYFGYEKCWNNATKQLEAYLDNKKSELGPVDLQEWSRCIGLNGANITTWNKMYSKYQETLSEDILIHLACSENSTILNDFLNMTISNSSIIPEKQVLSVFKAVCLYPSGDDKRINLCLNFIDSNFDDMRIRFGNSTDSFVTFLDLLASDIRQKTQLEQFKNILSVGRTTLDSTKLDARIKQTESRISIFEQKANYYEPFLKKKIENFYCFL